MKTNIREKLFSILLMAGGVIILLTISGFSSGFSIVKHNDSKQEASIQSVTSQLVQAPIPIMGQDTIPLPDPDAPEKIEQAELEKEIEVAKMEPMKVLEEVNWEEIKKEMELAQQEAIESIDWEELKKEMEVAKQQAMESIDWEELKLDLAETRIHVDSIMQDFDFDFDLDIDMEDIKVEMEEAMKEIENIRRAPATVPGKAIPGPTETPYKPWGTLWTPPQYWIKYEDRTSTAVKTAVAKTFVTISANRDAIKFKS